MASSSSVDVIIASAAGNKARPLDFKFQGATKEPFYSAYTTKRFPSLSQQGHARVLFSGRIKGSINLAPVGGTREEAAAARKMCYQVTCSSCGKTTWGGCGRHVKSVYKRIPQGQHCLCRDWPGVDRTKPIGDAAAAESEASSASSCTIL